MEKIKIELSILEKSFPFIKFTFTKPYDWIRIYINNQDTDNLDGCNFWYDTIRYIYEIESILSTYDFNKFLDQFITGLIKYCYD